MSYYNLYKETVEDLNLENDYGDVYFFKGDDGFYKGCVDYLKDDDILLIWSGCGLSESYGFEVKIQSETHLTDILIGLARGVNLGK